jgi:type 1 glutamine amidotransferase
MLLGRIIFSITLVCGWLCIIAASTAAESDEPLRVCLVSGSKEYMSHESLAEFQKYLESNYSVRCSRAFAADEKATSLPGLENLETCDVMVLFTRRVPLEGKDLERIKMYCQAGKPIVGIRTASHAIQNWLELDREVLGGNYKGHYGEGPLTQIEIVQENKSHPLLDGVAPWQSEGSLYKNPEIAADVTLLMTGAMPDGTREPITWTRTHRGGRIFYTSLGHPADFAEPSFRRMLTNAVFWTAGQQPTAKPNN